MVGGAILPTARSRPTGFPKERGGERLRLARRMRVIAPRGSTEHALPNGGIPVWPLSRPAGLARAVIQTAMFALVPLWAPGRVLGREALDGLEGPVLFAANHV